MKYRQCLSAQSGDALSRPNEIHAYEIAGFKKFTLRERCNLGFHKKNLDIFLDYARHVRFPFFRFRFL